MPMSLTTTSGRSASKCASASCHRRGRRDARAVAAQHVRQHVADVGLVVDDEQPPPAQERVPAGDAAGRLCGRGGLPAAATSTTRGSTTVKVAPLPTPPLSAATLPP